MGKRSEELQAAVIGIMRQRAKPLSAYQVLDEMRKSSPKMAPTTVYRTLAALTDKGLVHRLESMNAYVPCMCDCGGQMSVMSICSDCGAVQESMAPGLFKALDQVTGQTGFAASRHVIEVHGTCAACGPEASET